MGIFILIAAVMATVAAAAIAAPLLRHPRHRLQAAIAALIVAASAAALYPLWSNWDWHAPQSAPATPGPEVAAMVKRLEDHLRAVPDDAAGWLMLGRSYLALDRINEAVLAYGRAHELDGGNAEAALGLGEALSLKAGGEITREAGGLFEQGLSLAPDNPKALLYGGFAAAARGDRALARRRWEALKSLHPPPAIVQMLDERIAALGPLGSAAEAAGATPPGTNSSPAGMNAPSSPSSRALLAVKITLAPALKAKLTREAPLFVFAREPGAQGPPLAAKRLTTAALGSAVTLSAADAMMPQHALAPGERVTVTARVSFSGQPLAASGDWFGELELTAGSGGVAELMIDRVTP